jgi:glycosyltransferase involved in cell wall biosynthesis
LERWAFGLECLPYRLDVLHSPDFIPPAIGARKKVITIHDLTFHFFPQYQTSEARRYYQDQIARAVREADHILADSENTRQDVIRLMGASPGRITTAHLAANPLYARSVLPVVVDKTLAAYGLERGYILHVGTLEPRKNIPTLLHALKGLEAAGVAPVQLVLVGATGWLYQEIFQLVENLGVENQVRHLEGVADEELHHLYHGASLLAQPSFYEGFGLPPLEAMLCGCPVVSSNGGSLSEIVGHGGILLEPDNVEAWQGAIFNLLTDANLRQRLVEAGKRQAKKFGWRQMVETTLDVYRKVGLQ